MLTAQRGGLVFIGYLSSLISCFLIVWALSLTKSLCKMCNYCHNLAKEISISFWIVKTARVTGDHMAFLPKDDYFRLWVVLWSVFLLLCPQQHSWGRNRPTGDWMDPWEDTVLWEHCAATVWWPIRANKCVSSLKSWGQAHHITLDKGDTLPSKAFLTWMCPIAKYKGIFCPRWR